MKDKSSKDCEGCNGKCCRYVAIEIDTPETLEDMEDIKWYVCHKNIQVYVDDDKVWHIEFLSPCEFLGEDNMCTIYDKRPKICREYDHEECHFHNDYEEKHSFKTLSDVETYILDNFKK